MLLFFATWCPSMVDVLGLHVLISSFLLRALANLCFRETSIWKVCNEENNRYSVIISIFYVFRLDCTEAEIAFIIVHLITAISPSFWSHTVGIRTIEFNWKTSIYFLFKIPLINVELRTIAGLLILSSSSWSAANNIYITLSQGISEKRTPSVCTTNILLQFKYTILFRRVQIFWYLSGRLVFLCCSHWQLLCAQKHTFLSHIRHFF